MALDRLYETALTLVYDPVAANRNGTRASLHSIGFRNVELASSLEMLRDRMKLRSPDLLLVEVAGAETEACALVQSIRQGNLGDNPFVVVIVTTWRRDGTIVGQVLNSGADDLIARPVSAAMLGERIKAQIDRRKRWVVTMDYIGPDRRREARAGQGTECIDVPNSLKVRAVENLSEQDAELQIALSVQRGKETLDRQKLRRDVVQLCFQWRMLEQRAPGARDFREILARIDQLVSDIRPRLSAEQRTVGQSCDRIAESIQTMMGLGEARAEKASVDYKPALSVLGQYALVLGRMYAPDAVEPARLVELDRISAVRVPPSAAA